MTRVSAIVSSLAAGYLFFLAGCSTSVPPMYTTQPILNPVPDVAPLALVEADALNSESLSVTLPNLDTTPDPSNYVNSPASKILAFANPSVVIAVPVEKDTEVNSALDKNEFKTEGYIADYEPIIEKALIRKGFSVIDRSKFEAKLRDLRDRSADTGWHDTQDKIINRMINTLEKQLNAGEITEHEYTIKLNELQSSSKTRNKDEKEIVDMSELIRAAQSDGVKADYILQVNNKVQPRLSHQEELMLQGAEPVEEYRRRNPSLHYGYEAGNIVPSVPTPMYRCELSAKLINVATGRVIWVGSHELTSRSAEDFLITLEIAKRPSNLHAINEEIQKYNRESERLVTEARSIESALLQLYRQAMQVQKFDDGDVAEEYKQTMTAKISRYEENYRQAQAALQEHNAKRPATQPEVRYEYSVSKPLIKPNLGLIDSNDYMTRKSIEDHVKKLTNITVASLLDTIKVSNEPLPPVRPLQLQAPQEEAPRTPAVQEPLPPEPTIQKEESPQ